MAVQTELHRHLDVSIRPSTLLELAQERGLQPQSTSIESFREKLILTEPLSDLASVLSTFTICQQVLDRPDVLARVAEEAIEDIYSEGTRKVELRFSPSFVCEFSKLAWEDCLLGIEEGIARAKAKLPEIQTGLLCIASRDYGSQSVDQTIEFYLKNQDRMVGLDLAGNEVDFPQSLFRKSFMRAADRGARITIHAGEATGPETIWEAIEDLGAQRIGHGIACIQDPKLMEYLAKKQICLEMCPTSNWLTGVVPSLREHPLPQVLRAGVPVCINTDDPTLFGNTLPIESKICIEQMGMTPAEVQACHSHADRASFIPSKDLPGAN